MSTGRPCAELPAYGHDNVDERLPVYGDGFAGAARAIVPFVQGLELVRRRVELQKWTAAHGPVFRLARTAIGSTPGIFPIPAAISAE
jgi:hypothetical protein